MKIEEIVKLVEKYGIRGFYPAPFTIVTIGKGYTMDVMVKNNELRKVFIALEKKDEKKIEVADEKNNTDKELHCSFCGKEKNEVTKIIAGPTVYICNECISLCNDIIFEEYGFEKKKKFEEDKKINASQQACKEEVT